MCTFSTSVQKSIINVTFDEFISETSTENLDTLVTQWNTIQQDIVQHVSLEDRILPQNIKYIGGMDVSFSFTDKTKAIACLIIHDYNNKAVIARFTINATIFVPYKAGYLAFREAPVLLKLLENVKTSYPDYMPDIIMIDGNGIYHPRGCGVATHVSVLTNIPCIGISKNVFYVENITRENMIELINSNAPTKGSYCKITTSSGKELGYAYNVTGNAKKATYVSPGSYVSMDTSMEIVKYMSKYRVNESVRQADLFSRMVVKKVK